MHITRVAVALALAASTANALPWSRSQGDSANAQGVDLNNLDTTRGIRKEVSSSDSGIRYLKAGESSNQPHEPADNSHPTQKEMVMRDLSLDASQKMTLGHEYGIKSDLTGATSPDQRSEKMTYLTKAQSSVASSGSNNMPAVHRKAMEVQHHGPAKDASRSDNEINFAVSTRGLFRAFGQAWDQRAKLENDDQRQETRESMANTRRQDKSQIFMSTDEAHVVNGQRQADSMLRAEKVRQVRNHENCNQKPDSESANLYAQQHSALHQNHNYARSHIDGSNVRADSEQNLDRMQHQEQMDMREAKCSHQQQQMQQQMPEQMQKKMLQQEQEQEQEQANDQMQQSMQEQMQSRSEAAEDLQSAMDDFHGQVHPQ